MPDDALLPRWRSTVLPVGTLGLVWIHLSSHQYQPVVRFVDGNTNRRTLYSSLHVLSSIASVVYVFSLTDRSAGKFESRGSRWASNSADKRGQDLILLRPSLWNWAPQSPDMMQMHMAETRVFCVLLKRVCIVCRQLSPVHPPM
jgi:hypothetical protein